MLLLEFLLLPATPVSSEETLGLGYLPETADQNDGGGKGIGPILPHREHLFA